MTTTIKRTEFAALHDCFCNRIECTTNHIYFHFDEGFYLNAFNDEDEIIGTYLSNDCVMELSNPSNIIIYNSEEDSIITWNELVDHVNNKNWKLEFLLEEDSATGTIFTCDLHIKNNSDKRFLYTSFYITILIDHDDNIKSYGSIDLNRPW